MGFKCGIVGLPNVGKSTLFNSLTKAGIAAANYPFCTIDPNVGMVPVPDLRLAKIADIVNPQRVVPTTMEFVDIAGLVAGAANGEGLGNQFLAHIRETDAIAHVVRCFENDDVVHVAGKVDPLADIEVIDTELALADLEACDRARIKAEKAIKGGDKDAKVRMAVLDKVIPVLDQGKPIRSAGLDEEELKRLSDLNLLTNKPVMYIANVDEEGLQENPLVDRVRQRASEESACVVTVCAAIESELAQLDAEEQQEFLQELGLNESGLDQVIREGYALLGLKTFFTAGEKEVRAWTAHRSALAPQAAGRIHTDFERGFIRAEVIAYDDYISLGGEQKSKEAGKMRLEGKEYLVVEGDVIHFRFNV